MKYTQLGRTGLKVSRLVLGTMNFGPQTDEADSHAIMDAALDAGINFFDTANVYGWGENKGRTEEIIGTWFAKGGGRRDKVVLATKVYGNMAADGDGLAQPRQALRAQHPPRRRRQPQAAADRLHRPLPVPPHRPRTPRSRRSGRPSTSSSSRARSSTPGPSNFPGWKIAQANEIAARRAARIGLVSEQCLYNLAERRAEMEVIPAAQEYGLGVIPWSPLHGGLLGGVITQGARGRRARASGRAADALADTAVRAQIQAYEDLLDKHGLEPGEVAPGLAADPARRDRARSSARARAEQLDSALRAVELELSEELLAGLDEIFPGPGPSPEAFAW